MSVLEFILTYGDWYIFIGLLNASFWMPKRYRVGNRLSLVNLFVWDTVTWPADVARRFQSR